MKRTEREIYDFTKKKLEEAKDKLAKIGDGYKYSNNLDTECCVLEAKIEAYHEVLGFISEEPKIVGTTTVDKAFERFMLDACPEVKKKLKALEIIKKKLVNVSEVLMTANVEYYNNGYSEEFHLTQDEYDLVKEVMKCQ